MKSEGCQSRRNIAKVKESKGADGSAGVSLGGQRAVHRNGSPVKRSMNEVEEKMLRVEITIDLWIE